MSKNAQQQYGAKAMKTTIRKCGCGDRNCDQYTLSTQGSVGFSREDAQLYATAEDLLDCLEWAVAIAASHFYVCPDRSGKQIERLERARSTIAKARGEGAQP